MSRIIETIFILTVSLVAQTTTKQALYKSIPQNAFEIRIDRFDQIVPTEIQYGEMDANIVGIELRPTPPTPSKFSFIKEPRGISVQFQSSQSKRPILSGGPSWLDKKITWNWRTFPRIDAEEGINQLRKYLTSAVLVVSLADGRTVILNPPPIEGVINVRRSVEGSLVGETNCGIQISDAELAVEELSGVSWKLLNTMPRAIEGKIGTKDIRIDLTGSKCVIRQINAPFEELANQRRLLQENNELMPFLTPSQLEILLPECDALEKSIAELEIRAGIDRAEPVQSTFRLFITDKFSGRLYGLFTLDIQS